MWEGGPELKGLELFDYICLLVRNRAADRTAEILKGRSQLSDEHHTYFYNDFTLWLHERARIRPSEKYCLNWYGENMLFSDEIRDKLNTLKYKSVIDNTRVMLNFLTHKFLYSDDPVIAKTSVTLELMRIMENDPNLPALELQQHHPGAGKGEATITLDQYIIQKQKYGLRTKVRDVMGGVKENQTPTAYYLSTCVYDPEMELIAAILLNGGDMKDLQKLGYSKSEILNILNRFEASVMNNKIGELSWWRKWRIPHTINKKRFMLVSSIKAAKELVKSGTVVGAGSLVLGSGQISASLTNAIAGVERIIHDTINTLALTGIPTARHMWESSMFIDPWWLDAQINWMSIPELPPMDTWHRIALIAGLLGAWAACGDFKNTRWMVEQNKTSYIDWDLRVSFI